MKVFRNCIECGAGFERDISQRDFARGAGKLCSVKCRVEYTRVRLITPGAARRHAESLERDVALAARLAEKYGLEINQSAAAFILGKAADIRKRHGSEQ